jgi:hypothetical protein
MKNRYAWLVGLFSVTIVTAMTVALSGATAQELSSGKSARFRRLVLRETLPRPWRRRTRGFLVVPRGSRPPGPALTLTEQLTKLADLKQQGVITDAEFESQKAKILA